MERWRALAEDGVLFLIMSIFAVMKQMIGTGGRILWGQALTKLFTNLVAGVGFYSFLLSYKEWYGEYPQKVGVIMFVVYTGSRVIDTLVDRMFMWLKKINFKELIKKLLEL